MNIRKGIKSVILFSMGAILFSTFSVWSQPVDKEDRQTELYWQRQFLHYLHLIESHFDRTNGHFANQHYVESYAIRGIVTAFNHYTNDRNGFSYGLGCWGLIMSRLMSTRVRNLRTVFPLLSIISVKG